MQALVSINNLLKILIYFTILRHLLFVDCIFRLSCTFSCAVILFFVNIIFWFSNIIVCTVPTPFRCWYLNKQSVYSSVHTRWNVLSRESCRKVVFSFEIFGTLCWQYQRLRHPTRTDVRSNPLQDAPTNDRLLGRRTDVKPNFARVEMSKHLSAIWDCGSRTEWGRGGKLKCIAPTFPEDAFRVEQNSWLANRPVNTFKYHRFFFFFFITPFYKNTSYE